MPQVVTRSTDSAKINMLEELSFESWPALENFFDDGWILRFAEGFTRRSNSVWSLYESSDDLNEKIDRCEEFYRARRLPVTFRMTSAEDRAGLDVLLAERGYACVTPTSSQTLDLGKAGFECDPEVKLENALTTEWAEAFARMAGQNAHQAETFQRIVGSIDYPSCFASFDSGSGRVVFGMGVLQEAWIGLYGLYTHPSERRRGLGRRVFNSLLGWGIAAGARGAYIHVEKDNHAALPLYFELGFEEVYSYWYRVKPA